MGADPVLPDRPGALGAVTGVTRGVGALLHPATLGPRRKPGPTSTCRYGNSRPVAPRKACEDVLKRRPAFGDRDPGHARVSRRWWAHVRPARPRRTRDRSAGPGSPLAVALVADGGGVPGLLALLRRQQRRRHRRPRRAPLPAALPGVAGGRRRLDQPALPVRRRGRRLRRRRLPRGGPRLRRRRRPRGPGAGCPPARAACRPGRRPQPHLRPASVVPGRARRPGLPRGRALPLRPSLGGTAEQLAIPVRRPGVVPHAGRPVVPAPVRPRAAGPELAGPRRGRRLREDPALLARPRRQRLPCRRGVKLVQGRTTAGQPRRILPHPVRPRSGAGDDLEPARGARRLAALAVDLRRVPGHHARRRGLPGRPRRGGAVLAAGRAAPVVVVPAAQVALVGGVLRRGRAVRARRLRARRRPGVLGPRQPRQGPTGQPLRGRAAGTARARAAALLMLALPGSAYVYAGDELALPQAEVPDEAKRDPIFFRSDGARTGRDGCRVPIPWNASAGVGFSPGGAAGPWLPIPSGWRSYAVSRQTRDDGSTLHLYRRALALRADHPALGSGDATVSRRGDVLTVRCTGAGRTVRCVVNMGTETVLVRSAGTVLLASAAHVHSSGRTIALPADTAVWVAEN